ncbi:MAG: Tol-Pal system beta propeller repeat protein TolB [Myxococcota bacterium]
MGLSTSGLMVLLALSAQAGQQAGGQPLIDISGAGFQALPLAIPDVKVMKGSAPAPEGSPLRPDPAGDAAKEVTKVLRDDLTICGVFKILDPAGYLPNAQKEGIVAGTFNMADWLNIGATGLLKVGYTQDGDKRILEAHLYDVAQTREVLSVRYEGDKTAERRMAHRIADDVYHYYTRETGVFRTRIATVRQYKGKKDIFLVDVDGKNGKSLNLPDAINLLPGWDPDGQSLVFTSYINGGPDLYRVNLYSPGVTKLSNRPGLNTGGVVSPDGKFVAVTLSKDGNSEIYLLDRNGEIVKRLTNDPQIDSSPSWSPDGKKIAFVSARGGSPQIYVMDVEAGDKSAKRITFQGNYNQTPDWSPRGDKIAFTARDERLVFDVFVVDVNTNKIDRITQDQGNNEEPTWAPNGRLLAFTSDRNGSSQLIISTADGTQQRQVTADKGNLSTPAWGPLPKGEQ